jgi:hypothetical protein
MRSYSSIAPKISLLALLLRNCVYYLSTSGGTRNSSSGNDSDLSGFNRSDSDNSSVDSTRDAVNLLDEQFRKSVLLVG